MLDIVFTLMCLFLDEGPEFRTVSRAAPMAIPFRFESSGFAFHEEILANTCTAAVHPIDPPEPLTRPEHLLLSTLPRSARSPF